MDVATYPFELVQLIFEATWEVIKYTYKSSIRGVPVSYPGDPIANPLTRKGKWPSKRIKGAKNWKFACDAESHNVSQQSAPNHPMTGESAGRQIWYMDNDTSKYEEDDTTEHDLSFDPNENPNSGDKVFRKIMFQKWKGPRPSTDRPTSARETAIKGLSFYQMIQCDDGHWAGDYGGPMFLMPGLITVLYVTKAPFPAYKKRAMIQYLRNHQQEDGGWGTHIECASTMFGTVLSYTSLRLLGADPEEEYMKRGREFMHAHGGAIYAPSWAKFWLAVLGVYDWRGINPIPSEMWLLPRWFPFHPGKMWCHARMVYLPMCYTYCKRFVPAEVDTDPVLQGLRRELYLPTQNYDKIRWSSVRQLCASIDEYSPLNPVMRLAQDLMVGYERLIPYLPPLQWLRRTSLDFVIKYIHAEDHQTNYVDIGPVNKFLNMLSVWVDSGCKNDSTPFQRHIPRVDDYMWLAEDGLKMQGYNGSQCWDTSFCVQAIVEGGLARLFPECSRKVYDYLKRTQIAEDEENREYYFRHVSKGGWPFSTAAHGWPISDCTAEGLKGVLSLHRATTPDGRPLIPESDRIPAERLHDACDVILSFHNADGGWATYENNRGAGWYELLNPSEVFGDIMIDYSYVECSSACITALKQFREALPDYRPKEVSYAIEKGGQFLKSIQRPDGSWYGSWGVCFTYGTWFGIEGLVAAGEPLSSPSIAKAVTFILSKQNPNGGWGESYVACVDKAYPADGTGSAQRGLGCEGSGVVQTAWAVLGLLAAGLGKSSEERGVSSEQARREKEAVDRGVRFMMSKQLDSGDWAQEAITGVFNRSCGITYTAYRNVFPMWALCRYANECEGAASIE